MPRRRTGFHKYIKRTGTPGNYRYWYKMPDGSVREGDDEQQKAGRNEHASRLAAGRLAGTHSMSDREMAQEVYGDPGKSQKINSRRQNMRQRARRGGPKHEHHEHELHEAKYTGEQLSDFPYENRVRQLQVLIEQRKREREAAEPTPRPRRKTKRKTARATARRPARPEPSNALRAAIDSRTPIHVEQSSIYRFNQIGFSASTTGPPVISSNHWERLGIKDIRHRNLIRAKTKTVGTIARSKKIYIFRTDPGSSKYWVTSTGPDPTPAEGMVYREFPGFMAAADYANTLAITSEPTPEPTPTIPIKTPTERRKRELREQLKREHNIDFDQMFEETTPSEETPEAARASAERIRAAQRIKKSVMFVVNDSEDFQSRREIRKSMIAQIKRLKNANKFEMSSV